MSAVTMEEVLIPVGDVVLQGLLAIPERARGLVVFVHGSGSSRHSRRNRHVAYLLQEAGFATLLFDLLSDEEEREDVITARLRFDIRLLARRLAATIDWSEGQRELRGLPVGLFGASTGAAAALIAAAERPRTVRAVVSRGGRPDLAGEQLAQVDAPTLLVVGGDDVPVIKLNRDAAARLRTQHQLVIVPAATHLFEEPGKLDQVAGLAGDWFRRHLGAEGVLAAPANPSSPRASRT